MVMHFVKILMFTFWAVLDFALFGLFLLPVLEFAVSAGKSHLFIFILFSKHY